MPECSGWEARVPAYFEKDHGGLSGFGWSELELWQAQSAKDRQGALPC